MGLGIADALALRGIAVTIADINVQGIERVIESRSDRYFGVTLDVRDRTAWAEAKAKAESVFGAVDILVNNAGIGPDGKEFADLVPDSFDRLMSVDLTGVLNGIVTFAATLRAQGAGYIVNNASIVGLVSGVPGMGPYAAAKAGVVAMSEVLRMEMAPHGVGVSVLCPGPVATDFATTTIREGGATSDRWAHLKRMNASAVGECVVRGIESDEAYILTHPEYRAAFDQRASSIGDAFLRQTPS